MVTKCYALFDVKSAVFATPFFLLNDSMAVRSFGDLVNDKRSQVFAHPEDYSLYRVGEYDDSLGLLRAVKPEVVAMASALKKPDVNPFERLLPGIVDSAVTNGKEVVR